MVNDFGRKHSRFSYYTENNANSAAKELNIANVKHTREGWVKPAWPAELKYLTLTLLDGVPTSDAGRVG